MVKPARGFRRLAVTTAVLTYLLIIVGGVVRVTGSGDGCGSTGGWPLCNGSLLPALRTTTLIEFSHRWITVLATGLIVALALTAWLTQRRNRRMVIGSSVALGLLVVQIALGAIVVELNLPGNLVMVHLANALLLLSVLVYVAVSSYSVSAAMDDDVGGGPDGGEGGAPRLRGDAGAEAVGSPKRRRGGVPAAAGPPAALTLIAAIATYILALSGAFVVENGAGGACTGWPLCGNGFQPPASQFATINVAHRIIAGLVVLLIGATMGMIIRRNRGDRPLRLAAMVVNVLILLQIGAGALVVELGLPGAIRALHIALASALWATVVLVAVLIRQRAAQAVAAPYDAQPAEGFRRRAGVATS
jgi:heme A synthase